MKNVTTQKPTAAAKAASKQRSYNEDYRLLRNPLDGKPC